MFAVVWSCGNEQKFINNIIDMKSINVKNFKETLSPSLTNGSGSSVEKIFNPLDPYFITGFADAESCFYLVIKKSTKVKVGWLVELRFEIRLHKRDEPLLKLIKAYFNGIGIIYKDSKSVLYRVQRIKDLNIIIYHFNKYPLITQKLADFLLLKRVFELVICKKHLTEEGIKEIFALKASINNGLPSELKSVYPDLIPVTRPSVLDQEIKDPNWLSGFTAGEGCWATVRVCPDI